MTYRDPFVLFVIAATGVAVYATPAAAVTIAVLVGRTIRNRRAKETQ